MCFGRVRLGFGRVSHACVFYTPASYQRMDDGVTFFIRVLTTITLI